MVTFSNLPPPPQDSDWDMSDHTVSLTTEILSHHNSDINYEYGRNIDLLRKDFESKKKVHGRVRILMNNFLSVRISWVFRAIEGTRDLQ